MSKEIEPKKQTENVKKDIILSLIVILSTIGIIINNEPNQDMKIIPNSEQNITKQQLVKKSTIARMDFYTKLVNVDKPQFEIYVDGAEKAEPQAVWMNKHGSQGYIIQSDNDHTDVIIKGLQNTDINIVLRGYRGEDAAGKMIKNWVEYTSVKIDGKEILSEAKTVCYNKIFKYTIPVKAGETHTVEARWKETTMLPQKERRI